MLMSIKNGTISILIVSTPDLSLLTEEEIIVTSQRETSMSYAELKTKKDRIAFIRSQLQTNPAWAQRALIRIFDAQTLDEQNSSSTHEANGVGFTGADAYILTSFAEQLQKGRTLSEKQMAIVFKKIPKYSRQLEALT